MFTKDQRTEEEIWDYDRETGEDAQKDKESDIPSPAMAQ